jgi:hypothetical protein
VITPYGMVELVLGWSLDSRTWTHRSAPFSDALAAVHPDAAVLWDRVAEDLISGEIVTRVHVVRHPQVTTGLGEVMTGTEGTWFGGTAGGFRLEELDGVLAWRRRRYPPAPKVRR